MALLLYNTLSRSKHPFEPLHPPHVGLYVCGPTVYGDPHLGHARPAVTFDVLFRYLTHLGFKVRYVRNITDVGHLEFDADAGEDKIAKFARLNQLEPMEVAQLYTLRYHDAMRQLNVLPPSIEPRASGHIIEQIDLVSRILQSPFAYVADGSVYFDVPTYNQSHPYGVLSNRNISDILSDTRALDGQQDKRHPADFALWKRALPQHIMRWPSPWSEGFPGWHCECTAMARKYLGDHFDIHGGGIDLVFPHHEAEIAQATAAFGQPMVNTWVHNNLITVNGKKMGKSLGNFIPLDHFHPMTIRFFILQAHYRSTLDFSQPALDAAHKALQRLFDAFNRLPLLHTQPNAPIPAPLDNLAPRCFEALDDDLNTPTVIALLFDAAHAINTAYDNHTPLPPQLIPSLQQDFKLLFTDLLGVLPPTTHSLPDLQPFHLALDLLLELRALAKANKDWNTADLIRDRLASLGFTIADTKAGSQWTRNPQPSTNTSIQP